MVTPINSASGFSRTFYMIPHSTRRFATRSVLPSMPRPLQMTSQPSSIAVPTSTPSSTKSFASRRLRPPSVMSASLFQSVVRISASVRKSSSPFDNCISMKTSLASTLEPSTRNAFSETRNSTGARAFGHSEAARLTVPGDSLPGGKFWCLRHWC